MTIITANIENNNTKTKRLVQSKNNEKSNTNIIYVPRYYFPVTIV